MLDLVDTSTEYLHVVITPNNDECSKADVQAVTDMQLLMKKLGSNYKSACVSYMSKGNETLSRQLDAIQLSAYKNESGGNSRKIPSNSQNIAAKMVDIVEWFNNE